MIPFGLLGGNQDTTTLLGEEGTALIPAGGPGTRGDKKKKKKAQKHQHQQRRHASECVCVCVKCVSMLGVRWLLK